MIETPEYAVNPKGFRRAEAFEENDGIPLEGGSGFGQYLDRIALVASIVVGYTEINSTTTVDVSHRFADVYLRAVGGEAPVITIEGELPAGRRLIVDVRSLTGTCTLIIGGLTYTLYAADGVMEFFSTSDGWARPTVSFYSVRIQSVLNVQGSASVGGAFNAKAKAFVGGTLTVNGDATFNGRIVPRSDPSEITGFIAHENTLLLSRGIYMFVANTSIDVQLRYAGNWVPVGKLGGPIVAGTNTVRLFSTGGTTYYGLRY